MKITKRLKEMILAGATDPSMFKKKNDKTYLRYDSIQITSDKVIFKLDNIPVMEMNHNAVFAFGDTVTIENLKGKTKLGIT